MQLRCTGTNTSEVAAGDAMVPMFNATLVPLEGDNPPAFKIIGGVGTPAETMVYGKIYDLAEVAPVAE